MLKHLFSILLIIFEGIISTLSLYCQENKELLRILGTRYKYGIHNGYIKYIDDIDCYEVHQATDDILKSRMGLCNGNGDEIIPPKYDLIYSSYLKEHNFCLIKKDEMIGVYSIENRKEIVPPIYDEIRIDYKEVYAGESEQFPKFYVKKKGKYGLYCSLNGEIISPKYDKVDHYESFRCKVSSYDKTTIFDLISKKEIVPLIFDNVYLMDGKDFVRYEINNKYGLFSIAEQKKLTEAKYDYISQHFARNGFFNCENNGKYGLIDSLGIEIIPPSYSDIILGGDSIAVIIDNIEFDSQRNITKNGKWGVYNLKNKKQIVTPQYDFIRARNITENIILCNSGGTPTDEYEVVGGKWGGIDSDGNLVIPFEYEAISPFKNGVAQAQINGAIGLIENPLSGTNLIISSIINSTIDINIPKTEIINDETFAIIVANEAYTDITAPYSIRDGDIVAKYCESRLGIPKRNIMVYKDATFGTMQSIISHCSDISEVYDGNASFLFYFSGVGLMESSTKQMFLLPIDYSLSNINLTAVNVKELISNLNNLDLEKLVIITDCPFSGIDRAGSYITEDRGITIKQNPILNKGNYLWISTALSANKEIIDKNQGHGILTYCLLEILQQNKQIYLNKLIETLNTNVKKKTLEKNNEVFTPLIINNLDKNIKI